MRETNIKILAAAKIVFIFAVCISISVAINVILMKFAFQLWQCPPQIDCKESIWADLIVSATVVIPLLLLAIGTFNCRKSFFALSKNSAVWIFLLFSVLSLSFLLIFVTYKATFQLIKDAHF